MYRNISKAFPHALCVGAMLFLFSLEALATGDAGVSPAVKTNKEAPTPDSTTNTIVKSRWLDEHPKRLGLTYGADINLVANYIWRG